MSRAGGTVVDSSVLLDIFTVDETWALIGAHAAVTARALLTRDPRRVARHIPGLRLIAPERGA